jgi:hypothetical protein
LTTVSSDSFYLFVTFLRVLNREIWKIAAALYVFLAAVTETKLASAKMQTKVVGLLGLKYIKDWLLTKYNEII